jgi:hypothetical protein
MCVFVRCVCVCVCVYVYPVGFICEQLSLSSPLISTPRLYKQVFTKAADELKGANDVLGMVRVYLVLGP